MSLHEKLNEIALNVIHDMPNAVVEELLMEAMRRALVVPQDLLDEARASIPKFKNAAPDWERLNSIKTDPKLLAALEAAAERGLPPLGGTPVDHSVIGNFLAYGARPESEVLSYYNGPLLWTVTTPDLKGVAWWAHVRQSNGQPDYSQVRYHLFLWEDFDHVLSEMSCKPVLPLLKGAAKIYGIDMCELQRIAILAVHEMKFEDIDPGVLPDPDVILFNEARE